MIKKIPFLLAILTIIAGVFIAILFGVNESLFKNKILRDLQKNEKVISLSNESQRKEYVKAESEKNWRYYQRFHFHATGIAAMTLGILMLLSFSYGPDILKLTSAYMVSIGGFLYPFVWLFAAIYGPSLGRSVAKEQFAIFGYMGGVFLVGTVLAGFIVLRYPLRFKERLTE